MVEGIKNRDGKLGIWRIEEYREWEIGIGNMEGVRIRDMDGNEVGEVENGEIGDRRSGV